MGFPNNLKYTEEHEWILIEGNKATVGITSYAVEQLGEIVYLELPEVDEEFEVEASMGTVESTKAVSDIFMPITGKILEVNESLISSPDIIEQDPYVEGWLVKLEIEDLDSIENLMTPEAYNEFVEDQQD